MRIKTFYKFVETGELSPRALRDAAVVVDAHNFFFLTYEQSGLCYTYGCESVRYAAYLRTYLSMFKKANIKCYFIFKGGWHDMQKKLDIKPPSANIKRPIFTRNVIMEILKENNCEYVVCEYESKMDIIELAQKLDCPIISFDAEYCFSGHPYIPTPTLKFNERDDTIDCGLFLLEDFLKRYNLTASKMALFIVLRDQNIFQDDIFRAFFNHLRAPEAPYRRNLHLLWWLSKCSREKILNTIFMFISAENKKRFIKEERGVRQLIAPRPRGGLGAACALDRGAARVARADPRWFAKGVAAGHVAVDYVNLYRSKLFYGSNAPGDDERDDPMIPSLEIVKYAFDLLTNFQNDGFLFVCDTRQGKETMIVGDAHSIPKPAYEAEVCVFENGWDGVGALGLLEHFLRFALRPDALVAASRAPEPARLPLLALACCARRRPRARAAAAALLAHVALDLLRDRLHRPDPPEPPLGSTADRGAVTDADCDIAAVIMKDYFDAVTDGEADLILERRLLHPLVEYQQCLAQLVALNALCGAVLRAPRLSRTYNGTLAYRILRAMERAPDPALFLDHLLSPAPTVYAYLNGLLKIYEDLL